MKQRRRRQVRRRAHAAGVSRAIGRPPCTPKVVVTLAVDAGQALTALREMEADSLRLLTVAKLQALAASREIEYRAKDRKADLIAKIVAGR